MPMVISNFNYSDINSVTKSEATGENASVHTEVTNIVNDKVIKVESNEPGEIKVEVHNDEVKIESSPESSPQVTITNLSEEDKEEMLKETEEVISKTEQIQTTISSFLENIFSRLYETLVFWR